MKSSTYTVHQLAHCFDCDWYDEDYIDYNTRKRAYQHAKKTGHAVAVETGSVTRYN